MSEVGNAETDDVARPEPVEGRFATINQPSLISLKAPIDRLDYGV
jgi:hypothetical protein